MNKSTVFLTIFLAVSICTNIYLLIFGPSGPAKPASSVSPKECDCKIIGEAPSDPLWYADNIGGLEKYWQKPEWQGGAWVFEDTDGGWHKLCYPGVGKLEYWNGQKNQTATLTDEGCITVNKASFYYMPQNLKNQSI